MDIFAVIWQFSGGFLGVLIGRQLIVITLKQRRLSIDSGLDWPWEWANSIVLSYWALGLGLALSFVILVFSFEAAFLGLFVGALIGFMLRKTWKINQDMPNLQPEEEYTGD
jgi:hypothetical protein